VFIRCNRYAGAELTSERIVGPRYGDTMPIYLSLLVRANQSPHHVHSPIAS
jgi:hypothetical protein